MGIYSEILREKELNGLKIEQAADQALLKGSAVPVSFDHAEKVREAVAEILKKMQITPREIRGFTNTEELLDVMLDPENILYEKISLSDKTWRSQTNLILAFDESGDPRILYPTLIGYRCKEPGARGSKSCGSKVKLQEEAYVIFRPLKGDSFSLGSFIGLMIRLLSLSDIALIVLASLAVTILGLVAPNVNKQVLSRAVEIGEGAIPYLLGSAAVFVLAGILKGFFGIVKNFLINRMKQRISSQMQSAVMAKLLLLPYSSFSRGSVGKLSNQIRNSSRLSDMVITFVLNNLLTVIFSAAYIPQIKRLAPELLVPALLVLALQMILSVVLSITSAGHTKRKIALQQEEEGYAFEVLKGMQKIQNRGVHRIVFAKIADKFGRSLSAEMTPPLFILLHEQIITIVSAGGTALLLILAAASGMPQADYIAFTVSFGLISESVGALVSMCGNAVMMRPLIQQLSELFSDGVKESGVEYVRSLKGEIEISDLCFSYEAGRRGCVNHINLHISPGEKLAIVGESGCGKSTLLKLLLGMIDPDSGTILYDGKPLATLNKRSLRRQIASVFQFTRVFPGTIYDNICLNAPGLSEEEAMKAAEQAAIADNIRSLKLGLETEVTEGNGGGFSGGQKQRLNLARAFAQKPSVLILDEATSALDNVSQHKVLETVYGMKGTVIMVAHRLSTVIDCDRIIVLKDGCIVGEGNYEELIHSNDYFAELVRKQTPAAGSQAG